MSSTAPAAVQPRTGDMFEFAAHTGKTKITYYPFAPGPLIHGQTPGPSFAYDGPEGNLNFRGGQITQQETPAGQLLSVVLKPEADSGSLTFSLFLPPVSLATKDSQAFTTYGVKTRHSGWAEAPGAQLTYEVECLGGEAKSVMLAL